ncbi:hypothetical protein C8R45DRAFT_942811 [Mycena sanguinolenta]|nr:hypothetical protein C8R45DRAFT_942811 [Mycena sanguinolenta]
MSEGSPEHLSFWLNISGQKESKNEKKKKIGQAQSTQSPHGTPQEKPTREARRKHAALHAEESSTKNKLRVKDEGRETKRIEKRKQREERERHANPLRRRRATLPSDTEASREEKDAAEEGGKKKRAKKKQTENPTNGMLVQADIHCGASSWYSLTRARIPKASYGNFTVALLLAVLALRIAGVLAACRSRTSSICYFKIEE